MSEMYRFYDSDGSLLYLGISLDALRRVDQHRRLKAWWPLVARMEVEHFPAGVSRRDMERAEAAAIRLEHPRFNIAHRPRPSKRRTRREPARLCAIGEEVFVGGRWLCVARRSVDHVELVDLDTGSTIAWPANQPIERQVRRP